jgi:putative ABC transport system substrate-binding protein
MTHHTLAFLATRALGLLMAPLATDARPAGKVARIGMLTPASETSTPAFEAFRQGLRELGWVERQNLAIEWRLAEGRPDRFPALAAQLVSLPVDLIVTDTSTADKAAQRATTTIPIVMVTSADPVPRGLATSLARPGGNITGVTLHYGLTAANAGKFTVTILAENYSLWSG